MGDNSFFSYAKVAPIKLRTILLSRFFCWSKGYIFRCAFLFSFFVVFNFFVVVFIFLLSGELAASQLNTWYNSSGPTCNGLKYNSTSYKKKTKKELSELCVGANNTVVADMYAPFGKHIFCVLDLTLSHR